MSRQIPRLMSREAADLLIAGHPRLIVIERALRRTMLFWADYDNIPLPMPLRLHTVKQYARLFRRHLAAGNAETFDGANAAALAALREWREEYQALIRQFDMPGGEADCRPGVNPR